jgi:hypothetical protein
MYQFACERALSITIPVGTTPFNDNVFPLHVSKLAQTLPECLVAVHLRGKGAAS